MNSNSKWFWRKEIFKSIIFLIAVIIVEIQYGQAEDENHISISRSENDIRKEDKFIIGNEIDLRRTLIWGPGLHPHLIVLPARYFYIHFVGVDGQKRNTSERAADDLKVRIDCNGDREVWTQVLDKKDGGFIVRYKVFHTCSSGFRIIVTFAGLHLPNSPFITNVPVHSDSCNCPHFDAATWLRKMKCRTNLSQIDYDLAPFQPASVSFPEVLNKAIESFHRPNLHSFCHYAVKDNQVYRKCYGENVGFHIFPDAILLSLTRKMYIPDIEFIMNLGDWPLIDFGRVKTILPIFSWCKSNRTADILLPTYELTEASLEGMGRVTLDIMTVQANSDLRWDDKIPKLFWRGRDSRTERLDLIKIGRENPDLFNVSLTNFFFFRDKESIYGPKAERVSFFKFFDFKYQLNIDGTVAAYRFPYLLAGDSVIFKTDSPYYEHFYRELKPWLHYIPINPKLSDLVEKIAWAKDNDERVKEIAMRARKYAQENLMPLDVLCYHTTVYQMWSTRLKNPVVIRSDMEHVPQHDPNRPTVCDCGPAPTESSYDFKDEL